jgi:MFS family permease
MTPMESTTGVARDARTVSPSVERKLDAVNFFLADVRDGLGPYLAIYLLTVQNWNEASIGLVLAAGGLAGILAQTPAGALVDAVPRKRLLLAAAATLVTLASLLIPFLATAPLVTAANAAAMIAASAIAPAVAAITLGIVGPRAFARRIGRNEAYNHAGNAFSAALAAGLGYFFGPIVVFWLMAAVALASVIATLSIPGRAIDDRLARGFEEGGSHAHDQPSSFRVILSSKPLLIFAVTVVAFHFANAAMLPLVGQKLALVNKELGTSLMALCIVAAQLVMVPVSYFAAVNADRYGRKPIWLVGFVILALRGALYPVSDDPYWLVGVQLLDGFGAGIFGALFPIVVADLTRGTGHYNISLGAIATAHGIGAALSNGIAGFIVVHAGYDAAFLFLAGAAALGAMLVFTLMREPSRVTALDDARAVGDPVPLK